MKKTPLEKKDVYTGIVITSERQNERKKLPLEDQEIKFLQNKE